MPSPRPEKIAHKPNPHIPIMRQQTWRPSDLRSAGRSGKWHDRPSGSPRVPSSAPAQTIHAQAIADVKLSPLDEPPQKTFLVN